jgi:acetyl esterase/lipase
LDSGVSSRRSFLRGLAGAAGLVAAPPLLAACARKLPTTAAIDIASDLIAYGLAPMQVGELRVPVEQTPRPVVVLIHGGHWRTGFDRSAMTQVAGDLNRLGYATWNIDYRRVGDPGGGWPGTPLDVAAAVDHLAQLEKPKNLALDRVVFLGHSAGSQLAMWAGARSNLPPGSPGAAPAVTARGVISLSGVLDLALATGGVGGYAELAQSVKTFLGGAPAAVPDRYQLASPVQLVPIGRPALLLHGTVDSVVNVDQSRSFVAAAAQAGDRARLVELERANHFNVIDVDKAWWQHIVDWLPEQVGEPLIVPT